MHAVSRRDLLKATAAAGAAAVVLPGIAAPGIARSDGGANWPKAELTGKIVHPWDSDYTDASLGWNQYLIHYPMVIVFAQHTQDVVNALTWAQQNDVAFRVRSGRHQLWGWSAVDNGLVIDVSQLKSAQIDVASLTAKVGAGLTQVEAVTALAQQGLVIPTGDVASVGVIGATLGGGLGLFTRSLGMASDFVTEAEIVVASPDSGAKAITADRLRQCAGRRTAGLGDRLLGIQRRPAASDQGEVRPRQHLPVRAEHPAGDVMMTDSRLRDLN